MVESDMLLKNLVSKTQTSVVFMCYPCLNFGNSISEG